MDQIKTGNYIALKRKERNLTQEQLAEIIGVSNKTISKWECGKCMPDYSVIENLCNELNITVSELIGGHDSQQQGLVDDESFLHLVKEVDMLKISHIQANGTCLILLGLVAGHLSTCCSTLFGTVSLNVVSILSLLGGAFAIIWGIMRKRKNNSRK